MTELDFKRYNLSSQKMEKKTHSSDKIIEYLDEHVICLNELKKQKTTIYNIFKKIKKCANTNNRIFLIGNGGSASTASHFMCDLSNSVKLKKQKKIRAVALNDNVSKMLAIANDFGFEHLFENQLKEDMEKGDILIAISTSGNSKNILKAVKYANSIGGITIGLTGSKGKSLAKICNVSIKVPTDKVYQIEDIHLVLNHIITFLFMGYSYRGSKNKK